MSIPFIYTDCLESRSLSSDTLHRLYDMIPVQTALTLEPDKCAGVTDARVSNRMALAALLVPHPLDCRTDSLLLLQCLHSPKQHSNGVATADGVVSRSKVSGESLVSLLAGGRWESEDVHCFFVEALDGLVNCV